MDAEIKIERLARASAFMAALATAVGDGEAAHEYVDRMMRAWALLQPREAEQALGDDRLFGASGSW
ncbi:MAG TPA: hypothetical protein VF334_06970 [Polyangia bacterium]